MSEQSAKRNFEKTAFGALLGILATALLAIVGIYYTLHEKQPHISYEVVGDFKILDTYQPDKELEIRYRGEDLYALKKDLRVLTLAVRNDGGVHIKQADFEQALPWGIHINGGQIAAVPKVVSCNSDYIRNNINLQVSTNNTIIFQKIIFDKDKYFTISIWLLTRAYEEPELRVVGKVAGIEDQEVANKRRDPY